MTPIFFTAILLVIFAKTQICRFCYRLKQKFADLQKYYTFCTHKLQQKSQTKIIQKRQQEGWICTKTKPTILNKKIRRFLFDSRTLVKTKNRKTTWHLKNTVKECFTQRNSKQIFLVAPNPSHNPNTLPTAQARP